MASTRTGSKQLLRDLNQSIVFNVIAERGPISRTEVARKSNLPAATITRIVNNFIAAGLVFEKQSETSSGGRRPILLHINPVAGYVVGVKLREDSMTVTVCDLGCTVRHAYETVLETRVEPHRVIEAISEAVKHAVSSAGIQMRQVLGVGVGLAGLIDSSRGICHFSSILHWKDVELGPALEFKLHKPVRVDNDVNTLAVAERYFGAGKEASNFLLVTIGRGIGMGIVVGGEIYRGTHGGAGEFGHITIDLSPDAPVCSCGKRGCLEAIASDYGILRTVTRQEPGPHVEEAMARLIQDAQAGDTRLQHIFQHAGETLGVAIATLINIFDPATILIGGEGLRARDLILEPMRQTITRHVFGPSRGDIAIVVRQTDESYWARGAASLILREVFQAPIYEEGETLAIDDLLTQAALGQPKKRRKE